MQTIANKADERAIAQRAEWPTYPFVAYPTELSWMEHHRSLPTAQIRILALRRLADPITGEFQTTTQKLADLISMKRVAVQKGLRALQRAGFLYFRYVRGNTVRLTISFAGFPEPAYLRQGKPPLALDAKYPGLDVSETSLILKLAHSHLLTTLNKGLLHLRVNIMMPVADDRLRVVYSFNMDRDNDRDLELGIRSGAAGHCWKSGNSVICDLEDACRTFARKWRMNKAEQARVRPSLQSLLSVPILAPPSRRSISDNAVKKVAVLNFDSDEDLRREFRSRPILNAALEGATVLGTWLGGKNTWDLIHSA